MGELMSSGTGPRGTVHGFSFHALGGAGRLRLAGVNRREAEAAAIAAVEWLRGIERKLSRFQPESLVARLNRGEAVEPDADLLSWLSVAAEVARKTDGRLDVTAFPVWQLWHDPSRRHPPAEAEIRAALACRGLEHLVMDGGRLRFCRPGMALDFGGFGKEWCVDGLAAHVMRSGVRDFLVELAGDLVAHGQPAGDQPGWWVHLPGVAWALPLANAALATSGHRARGRTLGDLPVSHLIDARTGRPASGAIATATVMAATCLAAGTVATVVALAGDVGNALEGLGPFPGIVWTRERRCLIHPRLAERVRSVSHAGASVGGNTWECAA